MKLWTTQTFAALAALLITLSSIGAIVTVPPAQAYAAQSSPFVAELA